MVAKKRIFKLSGIVKELEKKNLVDADHVSSILDEFGRNSELINRVFNRCKGIKWKRQYGHEIRKFALTIHFFSPKAYNLHQRTISITCLYHTF